MRIYRHPVSKIWWAQYRNRRFSLRTKDETAARLRFNVEQRRDADPTYREADSSATLRAELDGFIARQRERSRAPETITMYELHRDLLCEVLGDDLPLAHVDAAAIERYVSHQTKAGDSKSYRWKQICTLRGALKRSRKLGRYPYALDQVMPDDLQPDSKPGDRHLMMPDVTALLAELAPARQAVVAFVVSTGADLSSIWRALPEDFGAATVRVRGSKNARRWREVPILAIFAQLVAIARAGVPYEPWASMRRDLCRACTRAKVGPLVPGTEADPPERIITPRDLRRSTGRILRAAGVAPHLIGPILGHAPGSPVTARTYAQVQPAELGALIDGVTAGTKTVRRAPRSRKKSAKKRAA